MSSGFLLPSLPLPAIWPPRIRFSVAARHLAFLAFASLPLPAIWPPPIHFCRCPPASGPPRNRFSAAARYLAPLAFQSGGSDFGVEGDQGVGLYFVHRLDRATSGLLLAARTSASANCLTQQLQGGTAGPSSPSGAAMEVDAASGGAAVQSVPCKRYAARVCGDFRRAGAAEQSEPAVICQEPIRTVDAKEGRRDCHPSGKPACTHFRFVCYIPEDDTSVVECRPTTGRTHQIRLHLQAIGFPIPNDPMYGPPGAKEVPGTPTESVAVQLQQGWEAAQYEELRQQAARSGVSAELEQLRSADMGAQKGLDVLFNQQQLRCNGIWLHAFRYTGRDWEFRVPLPSWAIPECEEWK
ncbi:hypothetical protein CYMTET_22815 [Cymbomonas tetramitiformis]|uniref:Pseudouridine synthase RsuA/RluA-like domain-containing protein n=1 Tax=Cymbomonas tetramitiformis TaxID=36881 RepID=A0AAE0L1J0_9CHLO|nr:hypothetical protein CYMTET_22815 [Cymbomonas tetramitiformis]